MPFFFLIPALALPFLLMMGKKKPKGPTPERAHPDPRAICRDLSRIQDPRVAVYLQKVEEWRREFGVNFPWGLEQKCYIEFLQKRAEILQGNPTGDNREALEQAALQYRVCRDRAKVAEERWRELAALRTAIVRDCLRRVEETASELSGLYIEDSSSCSRRILAEQGRKIARCRGDRECIRRVQRETIRRLRQECLGRPVLQVTW